MEEITRFPFSSQIVPPKNLSIILHGGCRPPVRRPELSLLPTIPPERLKPIFRGMDDLPPDVSLLGIDASIVAFCGYKVCKSGCTLAGLAIPRRSVVIGVYDPLGQLVALHNEHGKWFTTPKVHCRNLIRERWTNSLEIFNTTLEADAAAISRNVAVVALNGFEYGGTE